MAAISHHQIMFLLVRMGQAARADIVAKYSPQKVAGQVLQRLMEIASLKAETSGDV